MKRLFLSISAVCVAVMVSTNSCKKAEIAPSNARFGYSQVGNPSPLTLVLEATDWQIGTQGYNTCIFRNVVPYGRSSVKVYLVSGSYEQQINQAIHYKGAELWATRSESNVEIIFSCSCKPAVEPLVIKIIIE